MEVFKVSHTYKSYMNKLLPVWERLWMNLFATDCKKWCWKINELGAGQLLRQLASICNAQQDWIKCSAFPNCKPSGREKCTWIYCIVLHTSIFLFLSCQTWGDYQISYDFPSIPINVCSVLHLTAISGPKWSMFFEGAFVRQSWGSWTYSHQKIHHTSRFI